MTDNAAANLDEFVAQLGNLTAPSKRRIQSLTVIAEKLQKTQAGDIVQAVEHRIRHTEEGRPRMAAWYVLDSIVKNSPSIFTKLFGRHIASLACNFLTPWESYTKLFESWKPIFSSSALSRIEQHFAKSKGSSKVKAESSSKSKRQRDEPAQGNGALKIADLLKAVQAEGQPKKREHKVADQASQSPEDPETKQEDSPSRQSHATAIAHKKEKAKKPGKKDTKAETPERPQSPGIANEEAGAHSNLQSHDNDNDAEIAYAAIQEGGELIDSWPITAPVHSTKGKRERTPSEDEERSMTHAKKNRGSSPSKTKKRYSSIPDPAENEADAQDAMASVERSDEGQPEDEEVMHQFAHTSTEHYALSFDDEALDVAPPPPVKGQGNEEPLPVFFASTEVNERQAETDAIEEFQVSQLGESVPSRGGLRDHLRWQARNDGWSPPMVDESPRSKEESPGVGGEWMPLDEDLHHAAMHHVVNSRAPATDEFEVPLMDDAASPPSAQKLNDDGEFEVDYIDTLSLSGAGTPPRSPPASPLPPPPVVPQVPLRPFPSPQDMASMTSSPVDLLNDPVSPEASDLVPAPVSSFRHQAPSSMMEPSLSPPKNKVIMELPPVLEDSAEDEGDSKALFDILDQIEFEQQWAANTSTNRQVSPPAPLPTGRRSPPFKSQDHTIYKANQPTATKPAAAVDIYSLLEDIRLMHGPDKKRKQEQDAPPLFSHPLPSPSTHLRQLSPAPNPPPSVPGYLLPSSTRPITTMQERASPPPPPPVLAASPRSLPPPPPPPKPPTLLSPTSMPPVSPPSSGLMPFSSSPLPTAPSPTITDLAPRPMPPPPLPWQMRPPPPPSLSSFQPPPLPAGLSMSPAAKKARTSVPDPSQLDDMLPDFTF